MFDVPGGFLVLFQRDEAKVQRKVPMGKKKMVFWRQKSLKVGQNRSDLGQEDKE